MSRKKISTTVYITPEQNDRLHLLHSRTKVPVAVYIREGIDLVLKHYEHELPGQMSLVEAVAKNHVQPSSTTNAKAGTPKGAQLRKSLRAGAAEP